MADLEDGQFELDGVQFGLWCPMGVSDFSPGHAELVGNSTKIAGGDGVVFGRRRYGSANWSFRLFADRDSPNAALASYAELGKVWPSRVVRLNPGAVATLRYGLGGRTRVVFGQGGRWSPVVDNTLFGGTMAVAADFQTVNDLHYSDEVFTEIIPIALPVSTGGLIPPFITPFVSTSYNPARVGEITVGGDAPTEAWVTFTAGDGPLVDPKVTVAGWVAEVLDTVYINDPVTLDARPWARSATRQSGGGVRVSPRITQISKMILPPGNHTISFSGTDPTGTATATVHWRNAHTHL